MTRDPTRTLLTQPPATRRDRAGSIGIAVLLHVGLVLLVLSMKSPPEARPGPPGWAFSFSSGDAGGGGGGGESVTMIQLPPPPPPPPDVPTTQPLVPDVEIPELTLDPTVFALQPPTDSLPRPPGGFTPGSGSGAGPGTGTGSGGGSGSGVGTGTGSGRGAGRGGAGGDGVRPPAPLTILIPPAATPAVRGKAATVRLQVDSVGVVRDADVVVSSGDRGYDEKLRRIAMGWRFRPARDAANRAVAYPFEVSLRF